MASKLPPRLLRNVKIDRNGMEKSKQTHDTNTAMDKRSELIA